MGTPIGQLLQEPLGKPAYWDVDILTNECKSVPKAVLTLSNVMLSCGNKPTGLTYCEATQPECNQKFVRDHDVLIRGVLVIKKSEWLTREGRQALNKELRERDDNARRAAGHYDAPSDLTVGMVFSKRHKLKVWIQIRKRHKYPTQYMLSDKVPDGLCLWIDPDPERNRYFRIDSMDSETAHRSQLFFARYRIIHDMKELVNKAEQQNNDRIVTKARDPDWFIEQYMRHSYTGPSGDEYDDAKNKVGELLLEHYEWLVLDQSKQKSHRLFDPAAWQQWLKKQSGQRGPGDLDNYPEDEPMMVDNEIAEADRMEEDVAPARQSRRASGQSSRIGSAAPLQNAGRKRQLSPEISRPPSPDNEIQRGYESSGLEYIDNPGELAEPDYYRPSSDDDDVENYLLDGDFSSDEAPPQSDADSDDFVQSRQLTEPAVMVAIPYVLTLPPRIPLAGATWYCPVRDCDHDINMYDLSRDHPTIYALSKQQRDWIRSGGWSWQDPGLVDCFEALVSAHYQEHLDQLGIELVGGRRDIVARWKHPAEHPSKHGKVIVKEEKGASARCSTAVDIKPEPS